MAERGNGRKGRRPRRRPQRLSARRIALASTVVLIVGAAAAFFLVSSDSPVRYSSIEDHVKYGSTGSERTIGIPYAVFRALPRLCAEYMPGPSDQGYAPLGFIYERGRDLPVGFSRRSYKGSDLVGLNCGACHVGVIQDAEDREPRVYIGMPANTADIGALVRFLSQCATDESFTPERVIQAAEAEGLSLGLLDVLRLRYVDVFRARETLLMLRHRLEYTDENPAFGPGRIDTVTSTKAMFDLDLGEPYARPVGTVDFAAVWLQGKKAGMNLYWDGSNDSMQERHLLGAVHTGAIGTADMDSVMRIRNLFETEEPPAYPYGFQESLARRGAAVFDRVCSDCHGQSGREFSGRRVGEVTPLSSVRTDPGRSQSYTDEVAAKQRSLSPDGVVNLRRFKRTEGYANVPLDGIWLRAPYLHNGSVPSLQDLLEPARRRPKVFYRGDWMYDPSRVGFVYDVPERDGKKFFAYYTGLPGNSNRGHEGQRYGTELPRPDKEALIEYLKQF